MKKNCIITLLFVMMTMTVGAQAPSSYVVYTPYVSSLPVNKTIVREIASNASVSYVENSTHHYFVYQYGNAAANNLFGCFEINNTLFINDFIVANDTAFFCGRHASGEAIVGYIYFNNNTVPFIQGAIFSLNLPYSFTTVPLVSSHGIIQSFERMESAIVNGRRKIVALGKTQQSEYVVAEIQLNPAATSFSYKVGLLDASYNENLLDIVLTYNGVVTTGYQTQGGVSRPSIRTYKLTDVFMNGGQQDHVSLFTPNSPTVAKFDGTQQVCSHLSGNQFAMASYWQGQNSANNQGTYIGLFHVNNNMTVNFDNAIYTVQYSTGVSWKLREMTGYDLSSNFYLLQYAEMSGPFSPAGMIFELNNGLINNPSPVALRYRPDPTLYSIFARSGGNGYVANGGHTAVNQFLDYCIGAIPNNTCFFSDQLPVLHLPMVQMDIVKPFTVNEGETVFFQSGYTSQDTAGVFSVGCP